LLPLDILRGFSSHQLTEEVIDHSGAHGL
jgi:hypothetical protein